MSLSYIEIERKIRNLGDSITSKSKDVLSTDFTELEEDKGTYIADAVFDKTFTYVPEVMITDTVSGESLFMQWQKINDTTIRLTTTEPVNCTVSLM